MPCAGARMPLRSGGGGGGGDLSAAVVHAPGAFPRAAAARAGCCGRVPPRGGCCVKRCAADRPQRAQFQGRHVAAGAVTTRRTGRAREYRTTTAAREPTGCVRGRCFRRCAGRGVAAAPPRCCRRGCALACSGRLLRQPASLVTSRSVALRQCEVACRNAELSQSRRRRRRSRHDLAYGVSPRGRLRPDRTRARAAHHHHQWTSRAREHHLAVGKGAAAQPRSRQQQHAPG